MAVLTKPFAIEAMAAGIQEMIAAAGDWILTHWAE